MIGRRADAHQIARLVGRQHRHGLANDFEHHLLGFADGEAAERIAVEADCSERPRARLAQILIVAALHDAEQRLANGGHLERALAALGPTQ